MSELEKAEKEWLGATLLLLRNQSLSGVEARKLLEWIRTFVGDQVELECAICSAAHTGTQVDDDYFIQNPELESETPLGWVCLNCGEFFCKAHKRELGLGFWQLLRSRKKPGPICPACGRPFKHQELLRGAHPASAEQKARAPEIGTVYQSTCGLEMLDKEQHFALIERGIGVLYLENPRYRQFHEAASAKRIAAENGFLKTDSAYPSFDRLEESFKSWILQKGAAINRDQWAKRFFQAELPDPSIPDARRYALLYFHTPIRKDRLVALKRQAESGSEEAVDELIDIVQAEVEDLTLRREAWGLLEGLYYSSDIGEWADQRVTARGARCP